MRLESSVSASARHQRTKLLSLASSKIWVGTSIPAAWVPCASPVQLLFSRPVDACNDHGYECEYGFGDNIAEYGSDRRQKGSEGADYMAKGNLHAIKTAGRRPPHTTPRALP